ncbi:MAG: SRPBCC family protein [Hyphomonadaceae bacterium]
MRWFLGLVVVVALVTGVLYLVGQFLLPNSLEVTRTVTIERPRASVFAMVNDLRIAKEWSPFYARDPDADYAFSGDPGQGQSMRWRSDVRDVGNGRMSIVSSTENQQVESILELSDRATLSSRIDLRPTQTGANVEWTMSAQCAEGWINVPCRYMNLIMKGRVERQLEDGLNRLQTLAEQLPDENFEGLGITTVPTPAQDVIFVDVTITSDQPTFQDRENAERGGIAQLDLFFTSNNIRRDNALVRVFPQDNGVGGRYRFSVGYPFSGPLPLTLPGVRVGQTPEGAALRVEFVGRRSQIPLIYQRIEAYMQAHRIGSRPGADRWEVVSPLSAGDPRLAQGTPDDPIEQTEIFFPIQ